MKKGIIVGAIFGALAIPVATLGLAIRFIEVVSVPLTLVPRIIVNVLIDTSAVAGGMSIGLLIVVSALFYALLGGVIQKTAKQYGKWIAWGLVVVIYVGLVVAATQFVNFVPEKNIEQEFNDRSVATVEVGDVCETHSDCLLPIEYAIQSNCPYQAYCVEGACAVACPMWDHSPNQEESVSYQVTCEVDQDCDCSVWDSQGQYPCVCLSGTCASLVSE